MAHIGINEAKKEFYRLMDTLDAGLTRETFEAIAEIRKAAMRLSNLHERECNGVVGPDGFMKWDEEDQDRNDIAIERCKERVYKATSLAMDLESLGKVSIEIQSDPRGPSVIYHIKDGPQRVACFW